MKVKFIACMSALFCCLFFATPGSKASQVQPMATPMPYDRLSEKPKQIKSGIYTYEVMDEQAKKIALRYVDSVGEKLELPSHIDGYQVDVIGLRDISEDDYETWAFYKDENYSVILSGKENLKELTIPEGVSYVGRDAFEECPNLSKLNLPSNDGIELGPASFYNCKSLKRLTIRNYTGLGEWALGGEGVEEIELSGELSWTSEYRKPFGDRKTIRRIYIPRTKGKRADLCVFGQMSYIGEIIADAKVEELEFSRPYNQGSIVDKLVVNHKKTKLKYYDDPYFPSKTPLIFNSIYTVSGAKAISFAKSHKATHYVKKTGKTQKIKGKKTKKGYKASWKKVKTTVTTNKYKTAKKKWSKSVKAIKTIYQVYGKKKKTGKYQLVKTTKSRKMVTKYKYVKVVPKQTW